MPLVVYSTLSRKKEKFHKKPGDRVSMYVCGPTVYKPSHIGHMVGPVIFDTVKRYLTYAGYDVTWVVNITDVDDKLIARAKELGTTVPALAQTMTQDYFDCLKALAVVGIDHFPKATDHIPGMIGMIQTLVDKGSAYPAGGDVYFDVNKDADYGKLCNRDPEQLEVGSRIETSDKKRNPGDFALWKGAKPGEPAEVVFDSPWGKGRPGWHIECSAMSRALLGDTLDIHGGGLDLTFPHHENELAQSESANGAEFAKVWMHNGLLSLRDKDGKHAKMAGSIGNVLNVADALKHMGGPALRYFLLNTHYRSPIDLGIWDWNNPETPLPDNMVAAKKAFETFTRFAERAERITGKAFADIPNPYGSTTDTGATVAMKFVSTLRRFDMFLDDDFNTGGAVGVLFDLVTTLNKLADTAKLEDPMSGDTKSRNEFLEGAGLVKSVTDILGLDLTPPRVSFAIGLARGTSTATAVAEVTLGGEALEKWNKSQSIIEGLMQLLLDLRANLRDEAKSAAKDNPLKATLFAQTDLIRTRLAALGVALEDRPGGTSWRVG